MCDQRRFRSACASDSHLPYSENLKTVKRTGARRNHQNDMCDSDQSVHLPGLITIRCPHEENWSPSLPIKNNKAHNENWWVNGCPGWSEFLSGPRAHIMCYVETFNVFTRVWMSLFLHIPLLCRLWPGVQGGKKKGEWGEGDGRKWEGEGVGRKRGGRRHKRGGIEGERRR